MPLAHVRPSEQFTLNRLQTEEEGIDMAGKCEVCGKTLGFGHNVSFSKRRTNRVFRPNIQKTTVYTDGRAKQINACTRCIRTMAKLPK